jgi:hypothetical protein
MIEITEINDEIGDTTMIFVLRKLSVTKEGFHSNE